MSLLPVERGIPLPPAFVQPKRRHSGKPVYPWNLMCPGDSFFVAAGLRAASHVQTKLASLATRRREISGRTFTTRLVPGGVRVWRTE